MRKKAGLLLVVILLASMMVMVNGQSVMAWGLRYYPATGSSNPPGVEMSTPIKSGEIIYLGNRCTPVQKPTASAPGNNDKSEPNADKPTPPSSGKIIWLNKMPATPGKNTKTPPPTQPTPPPSNPGTDNSPAPGTSGTQQQEYLLGLINAARAENGVAPLTLDPRLTELATMKAQDLVDNNYFDHISPTYGSPFDMLRNAGVHYWYAGENLARAGNIGTCHALLWQSPGHRANMLEPHFNRVGLGIVPAKPSGVMVVELFIGTER
ncbi:MAG TPA: hypothetical protein GXZ96_06870 [Firmicutes bacterium]|nr:hypothetical protein [Bacillota bacterium]